MQGSADVLDARHVVVGRIGPPHGVRGWVTVWSYTEPRENILRYTPWYVQREGAWQPLTVVAGRIHGKGVVAQLQGVVDRDAAVALRGLDIAVDRSQFPPLPPGEYYWFELTGMQVVTVDGVALGVVDHLIETGANDVLVIKGDRERLVPYVRDEIVKSVSPEQRLITVDWDAEF